LAPCMKAGRSSVLGKGWIRQEQPWIVMGPADWAALTSRFHASGTK
jgi:hypothetical protein